MSAVAARLFGWLQGAKFYRDLHAEAVAAIGAGRGRSWLDVGCGPGLLTRLATDAGFNARGVDLSPDMIALARRLGNPAAFEVADVLAPGDDDKRYDVVSAASLLVVLPDAALGLQRLMALVKPGGALLVIEATSEMSKTRAWARILGGSLGPRSYMLALWAAARSRRTLPYETFDRPGLAVRHIPLLGGMVRASVVQ